MRILDQNGNALDSVYLALSDAEALELIAALEALREGAPDERFHQHVSDRDHQLEITVYREDDPSTVF